MKLHKLEHLEYAFKLKYLSFCDLGKDDSDTIALLVGLLLQDCSMDDLVNSLLITLDPYLGHQALVVLVNADISVDRLTTTVRS